MTRALVLTLALAPTAVAQPAKQPAAPGPDSQYRLGPDSLPQDGEERTAV